MLLIVPRLFSGFVEGDGGVSIEAPHTSRNTSVSGITWTELPGYGRTVSAITPWPRGGADLNFTAGTGPHVYVCYVLTLCYTLLTSFSASMISSRSTLLVEMGPSPSTHLLLHRSMHSATIVLFQLLCPWIRRNLRQPTLYRQILRLEMSQQLGMVLTVLLYVSIHHAVI